MVSHGDLKAKNILVASDKKTIVVTDFGLSHVGNNRDDLKKFGILATQMLYDIPYSSALKLSTSIPKRVSQLKDLVEDLF